jgi:hypothetical protein
LKGLFSCVTRRDLVDRIGKELSPLERMKRDYKEAKEGVAQEVRGALPALGVEKIVVTPLAKGWRIEGGADVARIIAGSSDAPFSMESSSGSAATMPARYTVSPCTTAWLNRGPTP